MVCLLMLSLKQCIIKQLLVSDFVTARLIKVSVSVISLPLNKPNLLKKLANCEDE